MKFQKRTIESRLFATALLMAFSVAPVVAAPSQSASATEVKIASATPVLKPVTAKIQVPGPAQATGPKAKRSVNRASDYRFSNPSRWNSDRTCNSIRNQ